MRYGKIYAHFGCHGSVSIKTASIIIQMRREYIFVSYISPNSYILYEKKIFTLFRSFELFCACVVLCFDIHLLCSSIFMCATERKLQDEP